MKRALSACLLAALALGLTSCLEPLPPGAPRDKPVPNNAFGATGTVRRYNPKDHCPEGDINYYLHMGGDLLVRLAAHGSWDDIRALERAIKTGEQVFVTGRRYPSDTSDCYYLLVNRVVPLGLPPEQSRPRRRMVERETQVTKVTTTKTTTTKIKPSGTAPVVVAPASTVPVTVPVTVAPSSVTPVPATTPVPALRPSIPSGGATPIPSPPGIPGITPSESGVPGTINPAPSTSGNRLKL